MVAITHAFQSGKADGPDDALVQPSDWNAEHSIELSATDRIVGRSSAGAGAAEEIPCTQHGRALIGSSVPIAGTPVGGIIDFAGSAAPSGWLMCYGQAISRTTYSHLFSAIGTTFGSGDGSTTFNVPDLRDRVTAGKGDMGGVAASRLTSAGSGVDGTVLGASGGEETHTLTADEVPELTGTAASAGAHTHTYGIGTTEDMDAGTGTDAMNNNTANQQNTGSAGAHTHEVTVNSDGGGAHNNVQPTMVLNKIIYAGA